MHDCVMHDMTPGVCDDKFASMLCVDQHMFANIIPIL